MNFEKQHMSFESFQEEIESLQSQLKEMSRLFFQTEEKITRDLTLLRDKINFQVSENENHKKTRESDDRTNELIQKRIYGVSPSDDKMRRMDDSILDEKIKSISKKDEIADDSKLLENSSTLSKNKRPQESLEQDENINNVEEKTYDIICHGSENEIHNRSTKITSNKAEVPNDDNVFDGENSEQFKDKFPTNIVARHRNSSIMGRMSTDTFYTVKSALTNQSRGIIDGLVRKNEIVQRDNQDDEPYKSSSFHMYAVGILTDSTKSNRHGWAVAFVSVAFTFLQFVVLTTVVYEASHPTCAAHDDCRFGEYCDFGSQWKGNSRCEDCILHKPNETNCPTFLSNILDYDHPDYVEVDYTKLAFGHNLDELNDIEKDCLVQIHCNETDVVENKCDFLRLNQVKWHATQKIAFVFMSLLFAALLCSDLQDAIAEETYMGMGFQNNNSLCPSKRMAGEFLRVSLRSRQLVLPWYASSAAIAIIISESLTAQNMLLNFLTIEVILIADDMFAILVLPLLHQDSTNKLLNLAAEKGVKVSYVWSRVVSIIATSVLVITVFQFDFVMDLYDAQTQTYQTCGDIGQSLEMLINLTLPLCAIAVHGFIVSFVKKMTNLTKRIMLGFGQVLIDLASWTSACTAWAIVLGATTRQEPIEIILPVVVLYQALYFAGHILRIFWSWKPVINSHQALYYEE